MTITINITAPRLHPTRPALMPRWSILYFLRRGPGSQARHDGTVSVPPRWDSEEDAQEYLDNILEECRAWLRHNPDGFFEPPYGHILVSEPFAGVPLPALSGDA